MVHFFGCPLTSMSLPPDWTELSGFDLHRPCRWPVCPLGNSDWKPPHMCHPHRWRLPGNCWLFVCLCHTDTWLSCKSKSQRWWFELRRHIDQSCCEHELCHHSSVWFPMLLQLFVFAGWYTVLAQQCSLEQQSLAQPASIAPCSAWTASADRSCQ